jgi:hypothetical protein
MTERMFFVFSNPTEGNDAEYNQWYDNTHLGEVVAVPNVTAAQRYTLDEIELPEAEGGPAPAPAHRYLAIYEVDGDPEVVMKDFMGRMAGGDMTVSPTLDMASVSMGFWSPRGPRITK